GPDGAATRGLPRYAGPLSGTDRRDQPIFLNVLVFPSFSILPPALRNAVMWSSICSRVRAAFCLPPDLPDLRRTVLLFLGAIKGLRVADGASPYRERCKNLSIGAGCRGKRRHLP